MNTLNTYIVGETASMARARFQAMGLEGDALELVVQAGGQQRHQHRVTLAANAALAFSRAEGFEGFYESRAVALGLLGAEMVGVGGGPFGKGWATRRQSWAGSLGKGRRQASDGGAWDSAILAAARQLLEESQATARFGVGQDGDCLTLSLYRGEEMVTEVALRGVIEDEWMESIALAALGVRTAEGGFIVGFEGAPAVWGKFYNFLRQPVATAEVPGGK